VGYQLSIDDRLIGKGGNAVTAYLFTGNAVHVGEYVCCQMLSLYLPTS